MALLVVPPIGSSTCHPSSSYANCQLEAQLDAQDHKALVLWASDCAERVLPHFEEERTADTRPRRAVEAARAWADGKIKMSQARTAAFDAHAVARKATRAEVRAAARAAGHAAATAHVATHAPHAADYAIKAVAYASDSAAIAAEERDWQYRRLPEHLRPVAFPKQCDD